jgi:hypothetical protein
MSGNLNPVDPPALPLGQNEYTRAYQDQLNNVQRLFYNRLTNNVNSLLGREGATYLQAPHAMLMSDQDQMSGGTTVANNLKFDTPVILEGIDVRGANNTEIWFERPGQYFVTFTLQVSNRSNAAQEFEVWAGFNGQNYPLSNRRFDVPARKTSSIWGHAVPSVTGIFTVQNPDTDYLTIKWWASSTDVFLEHYPVGTNPTRPEISSVIMTVNFISRLP